MAESAGGGALASELRVRLGEGGMATVYHTPSSEAEGTVLHSIMFETQARTGLTFP